MSNLITNKEYIISVVQSLTGKVVIDILPTIQINPKYIYGESIGINDSKFVFFGNLQVENQANDGTFTGQIALETQIQDSSINSGKNPFVVSFTETNFPFGSVYYKENFIFKKLSFTQVTAPTTFDSNVTYHFIGYKVNIG